MVKHKKVVEKYRKTGAYKAFLQLKKAKKFGKKPKDKNAPKRPSTSFFIFANVTRFFQKTSQFFFVPWLT